MMGTFATVLAKNKIPTPEERYQAEVTGDIENVDGILKITRIHVRYQLKLPSEKREAAQAALEVYLPYCPSAQSVIKAIHIEHDLEMEEL